MLEALPTSGTEVAPGRAAAVGSSWSASRRRLRPPRSQRSRAAQPRAACCCSPAQGLGGEALPCSVLSSPLRSPQAAAEALQHTRHGSHKWLLARGDPGLEQLSLGLPGRQTGDKAASTQPREETSAQPCQGTWGQQPEERAEKLREKGA